MLQGIYSVAYAMEMAGTIRKSYPKIWFTPPRRGTGARASFMRRLPPE